MSYLRKQDYLCLWGVADTCLAWRTWVNDTNEHWVRYLYRVVSFVIDIAIFQDITF
jgi:hypothetical protein